MINFYVLGEIIQISRVTLVLLSNETKNKICFHLWTVYFPHLNRPNYFVVVVEMLKERLKIGLWANKTTRFNHLDTILRDFLLSVIVSCVNLIADIFGFVYDNDHYLRQLSMVDKNYFIYYLFPFQKFFYTTIQLCFWQFWIN